MPQIIRKSNFDYEDHRGDERLVAAVKCHVEARIMCDALNKMQGPHGDDFYVVESDDYKMPPPWEP